MFKIKHFLSLAVLIALLTQTTRVQAASATITVSGTPWGLSTFTSEPQREMFVLISLIYKLRA